MRALALLALAVVVAAASLGLLARRGVFPETRAADARAAVPETTVVVTWCHEALQPSRLRLPHGHRVVLAVETTASESPGELTIPGYGDRVAPLAIVPGERREIRFVADRPGDHFEIRVGGVPAGRLDVTGEHVERDRL